MCNTYFQQICMPTCLLIGFVKIVKDLVLWPLNEHIDSNFQINNNMAYLYGNNAIFSIVPPKYSISICAAGRTFVSDNLKSLQQHINRKKK